MTQISCLVADCPYRLRGVCQRPAVDLDKVGCCRSFARVPGTLAGVGHAKRLRREGTVP